MAGQRSTAANSNCRNSDMKNRKYPFIKIIASLIIIVGLVTLIFNFKYYRGTPKLIAGREYGICHTELILKDNNTFHEQIDCLENESTRGDYRITNDTIHFEAYKNDEHEYKYGLVENSLYGKVLNLYNHKGVFETQLPIQMNRLIK